MAEVGVAALVGVGVAASVGVRVAEVEEEEVASGEVEEAVLEPPPTPPKQMLPTDHPRGTQARILTAGADLEWVSESGFEVRGVAKQ